MRPLLVTRDLRLHIGEVPACSWSAPRVATRAGLDRHIPFELDQLDGVFPLDGARDTRRFTPGTAPQLARVLGRSGPRDGPARAGRPAAGAAFASRPHSAGHRSNDAILD